MRALPTLVVPFAAVVRTVLTSTIVARTAAMVVLLIALSSGVVPLLHAGTPFSSSLPPNPTIEALLADVSADSLRSYIETLVAFTTRHTNSDTVSTTTGIGAARRWALARFQSHADRPGSSQEPSTFAFTTTTCGVNRLHRNVLCKIPGTLTPDRHFIVSGHLDSRNIVLCDAVVNAPGANDDGSGVAVSIEMSRVLSGQSLESSLIMMAVTGEEQGLLGSTAYAQWALTNGIRIDGFVTNDVVGNIQGCVDPACPPGEPVITDSTSIRHFSRGPSTSIHRQLTRAMKLAAERYVPGFTVNLVPLRDRPGRAGDHFPFDDRGYAAARFTEPYEFGDGTGLNGHQHNGTDSLQYMHIPFLATVTRVNLAGFVSLALAPETPEAPTVVSVGEGDLHLSWPSVLTAPDVAGYRVALRATQAPADTLFYFEIYDAGLDAGPTQEHVISGLPFGETVLVSVSCYDTDGNESVFSVETAATPIVGVAGASAGTPGELLGPMRPNPAEGRAEIRLIVPRSGRLRLEVLDTGGRLVALLADEMSSAGARRVAWEGRDRTGHVAPAGVYFVRMVLDDRVVGSEKLTLIRAAPAVR